MHCVAFTLESSTVTLYSVVLETEFTTIVFMFEYSVVLRMFE